MKHILWLPGWYPDELNAYNGDFIQRHAHAVAEQLPITVIYVAQHGPDVNILQSRAVTNTTGQLTEIIIYFKYKKTGFGLLDKLRYNLGYFHTFRQYLQQYIAQKGKPDMVHVHVPMKAGRMALWLQHKLQVPYIISEHSSAYSEEVPDNYHNRSNYYRKWVRLIFKQAAAATTVSQKLGRRLQELFAIRHMHIIPNVADTRYFHYSPSQPERFRFLHASTMDHPKNVQGMLQAFHQLKKLRHDWECVMLGWDTPELKRLATTLGLDTHITWKGVVAYQQVAKEMQYASALLLFSRYENLPCVVLESLCCGLPVIATAVGGIPEVINASNGMLVQPGNEGELLQAMLQCMEHPERFNRQSIAAQAQQLFSYETVGKQFADLYREFAGT
ncbi:MAG TPA: glycosyltransferase [Chitinophagaceae bacterium]|nr:glycosyltransferase [Chitinophagaceae bacterium]